MRRLLAFVLLAGFGPFAIAQSLVVPNRTGSILASGQTFSVQYAPGADSGGFDFTLAANPASGVSFTAASGSIPNGTTNCSATATRVICIVTADLPTADLGAGSITVTYTGGATPGPVALGFTDATFFDQFANLEPGTTTGGTLTLQRQTQATLSVVATPAALVFGGTATLSTSGGSGSGAVGYAVTAGATFCSVSGSTLTATGVGTCTVTATKAGDAQFEPATATTSVVVSRANQAPLAVTATPSTVTVGATSALSTSGGSGSGAVSYAITAGASSCTVSASTLTAIAGGICTVTATKAADANYNSASATTQVTVPNSLPTIAAAATLTTLEDLSSEPLAITIGDAETAAGALVLSASSSNAALVTNAALAAGLGGAGANRSLVVSPVANASGSATITLQVADGSGGTASRAVALTVTPVNDPPSFTVAGPITTAPGASGAQTRTGFVTGVVLGPADEQATQAVQGYAVTQVSDPADVVGAIALANNGTLTFTLSGTPGVADFSAVLTDNGGTANGGIAASAPQAIRIVVPLSGDLAVTLGNGEPVVPTGSQPTWELVVSNAGPSTASGARVQFALPAGLTGATWTCAPVALATCPAAAGTGGIDQLVDLPSGGALRWRLTATVSAAIGATIAATASVAAPTGVVDPDPQDNTASDSDPVVPEQVFADDFESAAAPKVAVPDAVSRD
jgi:hypothetical protein